VRLIERDKGTVFIRRKTEAGSDAYNEPVAGWEAPEAIRATAQPLRSALDAHVYGLRAERMIAIFYDGPLRVREGDCLCVDAPPEGAPDYRAVSVARWGGYQRIDAERIGDGRHDGA